MNPRELERFLRGLGHSQRAAKIAVADARKQGLTDELGTLGRWLQNFKKRRAADAT